MLSRNSILLIFKRTKQFAMDRPTTTVAAENLFLRKQLGLFIERKAKPRRATDAIRFSLARLSRLFDWSNALTIVKSDNLIRWHRKGFRLLWKWKSRPRSPTSRSPRTAKIRSTDKRRTDCPTGPAPGSRRTGTITHSGATPGPAKAAPVRRPHGRPASRKDKNGRPMPVRADRDRPMKWFFEAVPRQDFYDAMLLSGDDRRPRCVKGSGANGSSQWFC
jgi:hypothetical protein